MKTISLWFYPIIFEILQFQIDGQTWTNSDQIYIHLHFSNDK